MILTDIIETGCVAIAIDADGMEQPCGGPVVAVRRRTGCGDGDGIGDVCAKHAAEPGTEFVPLKDIPDRLALPFPLTYEDVEDGDPSDQPRVGDYGWAVRENAHGQDETPFHIERDGDTGLPVALLDTRPYAKPEDDVDDGQYVSLLQLHLDGYILSRTGRKTDEDE